MKRTPTQRSTDDRDLEARGRWVEHGKIYAGSTGSVSRPITAGRRSTVDWKSGRCKKAEATGRGELEVETTWWPS